jgi:cytochrome P450
MTGTAMDLYYDPYDYGVDVDAHAIWRRLRDEQPVYWNDRYEFFALSRYDDVRDASVDWRTYSSASGTVLEIIKDPKSLELMRNMLFEDPPVHDLHRSILGRVFTPRRVAALEPRVRELCAMFLDPMVGTGGFDFVQDFGALLPMMVIGALLGIPAEDQNEIRHLVDQSMHREDGKTGGGAALHFQILDYFKRYIAFRRQNPTDDLMTDMIEATIVDESGAERHLRDNEMLNYMWLVASAGNETVARLLGWAGFTLARFPEERRLLVDDPTLIPNAVEELLRFEPPSPVQGRVLTADVELHGTTMPAGSAVLLLTGSAGRDDREFPDPDRFDVRREIHHHLSFGQGVHFCLGAALARLEGRVGVEEVLRRFPTWEVDDAGAEMVHTSTVRGWERLPVVV